MEILTEIIELSEAIIDTLIENNFFEENVFVEPRGLKIALQIRMQRKWEQEGEILLSDKEFIDVCNSEVEKAVNESLTALVDKGAVDMAINSDGEIVYSANKDFDIEKLDDEI